MWDLLLEFAILVFNLHTVYDRDPSVFAQLRKVFHEMIPERSFRPELAQVNVHIGVFPIKTDELLK